LTADGQSGGDGVTAMHLATLGSDTGIAVVQNLLQTTGVLIVQEMERKQKIATPIRAQVCLL